MSAKAERLANLDLGRMLACLAVVWVLWSGRANKARHGFAVKPAWAEAVLTLIIVGVVSRPLVRRPHMSSGVPPHMGDEIINGLALPRLFYLRLGVLLVDGMAHDVGLSYAALLSKTLQSRVLFCGYVQLLPDHGHDVYIVAYIAWRLDTALL